ncbi:MULTISPECIES: competence system sensor histidine kinase ComD [Streptococcus]|uniref:ATPase/histidine kinase/DNA gyrase B/HSP90 domain protein n=1 Tax=Streptococcus mitis bv. 2 str. F0392 TaxID=768726 RepID=F9P263_STROR|nr:MULTISPECIES: competence system sensor histidine kinase ComD [Streptococcus]EGR92827.1 ATPase/histidine kinase/DNA gyrase B/HSP90 domain protein [Streptococcus mitis bv. 2 str. F0392]RSJ02914.1 sensory histidine kinase DcuS [Streptococcus mitis]
MNLFGLVIAFFYVFIISKIYEWTCSATKKEKYIYSLYVFLLQLILEEIMYLLALDGYGLSKFLFPLLIFGYFVGFQKYDKSKGVFISLLFSLLYHSSNNFISVTLSSITGDDIALEYNNYFIIFVLILTYLVIKIVISYFHLEFKYFDKEYLYSFLKKVLYAFIFLHIVSFISDIVSTISHLNSFGSILSTIVFICLLLIFFAMNSYKVQIEKEIALKQKKFEQKHLQTYTDEIVKLYNEIRGFRHDYAGMLVSMQMAIDSEDLQEIDRVYNEVLVKANQKLRSEKYTYFDLNNLEDSALRSLIAQSIVYARNNDVEFTLEVKDVITRLSMDLLDLVRIMSILLNNAVEGAADSYLKQMEVAVIKMDFETVIVIQNSCKITMTPSEDLFALGFSTKGRNRGLGLNNVKEILDKYDNIMLETEMEDNTFRQIIRFKREFE